MAGRRKLVAPRLAALIEGYTLRHHAHDLEVALAGVSVDPTKPETILNRFPSLAADPLAVETVRRIVRTRRSEG